MQEFMLFPHGAESFTEAMKMGTETYHHLKAGIKKVNIFFCQNLRKVI